MDISKKGDSRPEASQSTEKPTAQLSREEVRKVLEQARSEADRFTRGKVPATDTEAPASASQAQECAASAREKEPEAPHPDGAVAPETRDRETEKLSKDQVRGVLEQARKEVEANESPAGETEPAEPAVDDSDNDKPGGISGFLRRLFHRDG